MSIWAVNWAFQLVSMKSGLEDRNNVGAGAECEVAEHVVSMKSGLEDRNNLTRG